MGKDEKRPKPYPDGNPKFCSDETTWRLVGFQPPSKLNSDEVVALWLDAMLDRQPLILSDDERRVYERIREEVLAAREAGITLEVPSDVYEPPPKRAKLLDPSFPASLAREPGVQHFAVVSNWAVEVFYRATRDGKTTLLERLTADGWVEDDNLMLYFIGREYGLRAVVDVTDGDVDTLKKALATRSSGQAS